MVTANRPKVSNRREAGSLLANVLQPYAGTDALVVGIPRGGVIVAAEVARRLNLALEVLPCRKILHPADNQKAIGSVSPDEVVVDGANYDIPQDFISHQIILLKNCLRNEWKKYHSGRLPLSFRYKTVIVVDDVLRSGNTMLACLKSIRKHHPLKLIAAVPFVSAEAVRVINALADDVVFIQMDHVFGLPKDFYMEFPEVEESEVIALMQAADETRSVPT